MGKLLVFDFPTQELLDDFYGWFLDGGGEQGFEPQSGGWVNFKVVNNNTIEVVEHKDEE